MLEGWPPWSKVKASAETAPWPCLVIQVHTLAMVYVGPQYMHRVQSKRSGREAQIGKHFGPLLKHPPFVGRQARSSWCPHTLDHCHHISRQTHGQKCLSISRLDVKSFPLEGCMEHSSAGLQQQWMGQSQQEAENECRKSTVALSVLQDWIMDLHNHVCPSQHCLHKLN